MYYECRHIMPNGSKCHSPSVQGTHFCYFHTRLHRLANQAKPAPTPLALAPVGEQSIEIPFLEDRSAIQIALSQILKGLAASKLDPRSAGILIYGLQVASQNVERRQDILPYKAVESITHTREGDELAPRLRICDSKEDCLICPDRETCPDANTDEDEQEIQDEDQDAA